MVRSPIIGSHLHRAAKLDLCRRLLATACSLLLPQPADCRDFWVVLTSTNVIDGLECVGPLKTTDDIVTSKLDLTSGAIDLPPGPGLGVTLDEGKLARYRYA